MKKSELKQLIREEVEKLTLEPKTSFAIHRYLSKKVKGFKDEYPIASHFYFDIIKNIEP